MSKRTEQIESVLIRSISKVLSRQIADPRISGMVSVTRVDVSPDLHEAYVYVSVMPARHEKKTIYGLKHAAGYIESLVRKDVRLRQVPHFDFRLDSSLKTSAAVFDAIKRGLEDQAETPDQADPDSPASAAPPSDEADDSTNQGEASP